MSGTVRTIPVALLLLGLLAPSASGDDRPIRVAKRNLVVVAAPNAGLTRRQAIRIAKLAEKAFSETRKVLDLDLPEIFFPGRYPPWWIPDPEVAENRIKIEIRKEVPADWRGGCAG